jgi:hypothetical protein
MVADKCRWADQREFSRIRREVSVGNDRFLFRQYPLRNPTEKKPTKTLSDPIGISRKSSDSDCIRRRIPLGSDGIWRSDWMTWVVNLEQNKTVQFSFVDAFCVILQVTLVATTRLTLDWTRSKHPLLRIPKQCSENYRWAFT